MTVPILDSPGVLTTWTYTWGADETLGPIEVEAAEDTEADWEAAVQELVRRSLEDAFNGRQERFFRRDTFAYMGGRLDGEYWISGSRIAPADPNDDGDLLSERIVVLDHWVTAVDHRRSIAVGQLEATRFMTLLGAFAGLGFYSISFEKRWVYTAPGESNRYQLGFRPQREAPDSMPRKGAECRPGKPVAYKRHNPLGVHPDGLRLHLPNDIRTLFRAFQRLPLPQQEAFFGAAALFRLARTIGRGLPSVQMSYLVASVDALLEEHSQHSFVELVHRYRPDASAAMLRFMYGNVRSGLFHTGQFTFGEYEPLEIKMVQGPSRAIQMNLQLVASNILNSVLIDWLLDKSNDAP